MSKFVVETDGSPAQTAPADEVPQADRVNLRQRAYHDLCQRGLAVQDLYTAFKARNSDGVPVLLMDYRNYVETMDASLDVGTMQECFSMVDKERTFEGSGPLAEPKNAERMIILVGPTCKNSTHYIESLPLEFLQKLGKENLPLLAG